MMTLQNRVDPWGNLNAHPSKQATLMGNRGVLHNDLKEIVRPWRLKAWINCVTEFKGNKRRLFSPNRYSELFFLDEATAFSASHRPCAECQRPRSNQFKTAWLQANLSDHCTEQRPHTKIKLSEIDKQLHQERIDQDHSKVTFDARIQDLPVGTSVEYLGQTLMIVATRVYLKWSFDGYTDALKLEDETTVKVLTPQSIVNAFQYAFTPTFHPSVQQFMGTS